MSTKSSTASSPETTARRRWEAALAGDREALVELCVFSSYPAFAWLRAGDADDAEAARQTEDFFAWIVGVEPPRPDEEEVERWQDFLLARLEAYATAGFPIPEAAPVIALDAESAAARFTKEPARTAHDIFIRRWALTMLEATMETLRAEYAAEGKADLFPHLPQFLSFSAGEEKYTELAPEIGMSVSGLHVAVYRFRQRYREMLRRTVGDTVREAGDVDSELTKLLVGAS